MFQKSFTILEQLFIQKFEHNVTMGGIWPAKRGALDHFRHKYGFIHVARKWSSAPMPANLLSPNEYDVMWKIFEFPLFFLLFSYYFPVFFL
ncbi:hypothetical protein [Enterococcus cecorum]|uniref:hypothetical protein n=1 Tax=Enterococcus cecorum TaxID=44008 RepID=UPI003F5231DB